MTKHHIPSFMTGIALLLPITHRGICNHLERDRPGWMFETAAEDPGGPLFVMTTAGYVMGPELRIERVIDFRREMLTAG